MRDSNHPVFQAARALDDALGNQIAVPNYDSLAQLIWATYARSKQTYEAVSHLLGHEFDTQAAMLCRSLFEDMIVAHWLSLNRDDSGWLVERYFRQERAIALDQIALQQQYSWATGPLLVDDTRELRAEQNALGREFRGGRRDWWDPGEHGRGAGSPIGIEGVAALLEDAALAHERFDPRFAGGEEPLLRRYEAVILKWFSRQLHHTALGLPFQPSIDGPVRFKNDPQAALRTILTAYWIFGQQGYLLLEHFEEDVQTYSGTFMQGLMTIGAQISPTAAAEHPPQPYERG